MLTFRQNRVNACGLRAAVLVSTLKTACTTFGVYNAIKIAFKRQNIPNRRELTLFFHQNREKGCILRTVGLVSTLKQTCVVLVH